MIIASFANLTPADAQTAASMCTALQRLRDNDIADDAIRTTLYDMRPEFEFVDGRRIERGFVAANSADVRVDAIGRFGEMLAIAVAAGSNSVGGVRFDVSDRAVLEREALRLAVADARTRADAVAFGAGMRVERVLRIDEQRGPRVLQAKSVQAFTAAEVPPIAAGPITPGAGRSDGGPRMGHKAPGGDRL